MEMAKKEFVFKDKDGKEWSRENLQELIDAVRAFRDFKAVVEYYDYNL